MPSDTVFRSAVFGGFNRNDVINYIEKLKLNEAKLMAEVTSKNSKIEELQKTVDELNSKISELNNKTQAVYVECEDKIAEIKNQCSEEIEKIREELSEKSNSESLAERSAQEKVGTAMLDVRRYADLLLSETCEKISKMSDDADIAASKTLSRVLDISSGIQTFSDKLNSILADLLKENEAICRELTGFKGSLKLPFDEASGKINAEIFGE